MLLYINESYLLYLIYYEINIFWVIIVGIMGNEGTLLSNPDHGPRVCQPEPGPREGSPGLIPPFFRRWISSLSMNFPWLLLLAVILASLLIMAGCTGLGRSGSPVESVPTTSPGSTAQGPVVEADAYPPGEPYEIDPGFVRNSPEYRVDPALFTDVYSNRFTLGYNSVGLLATVDRAPLVIDFSVTPGNADPVYSFFILTVRDAESQEVVGQEGYGRTYSTESQKRLVFTRPGRYHLNLYGNWVDVDLRVRMKT